LLLGRLGSGRLRYLGSGSGADRAVAAPGVRAGCGVAVLACGPVVVDDEPGVASCGGAAYAVGTPRPAGPSDTTAIHCLSGAKLGRYECDNVHALSCTLSHS
jgi:hypothetical protein